MSVVGQWPQGDCCENPHLGPVSTGCDGPVIAAASRCQNCGVMVMTTVDVEASDA